MPLLKGRKNEVNPDHTQVFECNEQLLPMLVTAAVTDFL